MQQLKKRLLQYDTLVMVLLLLFVIIAMFFYVNSSTKQIRQDSSKTLIIFAEALPYFIASENLDSLPTLKMLCEEGSCLSMRPAAPTFTTMQNYVLETGKNPSDVNYAYNFIINDSALRQNKCSFVGEITDLSNTKQKNLFAEIAANYKFVSYSIVSEDMERYAEDIFPSIPELLLNNDVVYTYVTDTDSHYTNLSHVSETSPIMLKFKEFDKKLGVLIKELKNKNLYDKTNIILFGDHGMSAIRQFEYLPEILAELENYAEINDLCYWNDAGTSLRFWILPKAEKKEEIKTNIINYFLTKPECFYIVNDAVLKEINLFLKNSTRRFLSFGDVHIGIRPECKVNTQRASGGMEHGFAEHQNRVDKYISMHGYLNIFHPELQAFLLVKLGSDNEKMNISENFAIKDLHNLIKNIFFNDGYYK